MSDHAQAVGTLSATEAITNVKARYCLAVDFQDWPAFGQLFTADASFDLSQMHYALDARTGERIPDPSFSDEFLDRSSGAAGMQWPIVGRQAIEDYCAAGMAKIRSTHQFHLPVIEMTSATAARAVFPMEDWLWFDDGMPFRSMHGLGHYHETYRWSDGGGGSRRCGSAGCASTGPEEGPREDATLLRPGSIEDAITMPSPGPSGPCAI